MDAKIRFSALFLRCFFRLRFSIDFCWICGGSKLEKSIKTIGFSIVFVKFPKIEVFEKVAKKDRFWIDFWRPKRRKFDYKSSSKTCCFPTSTLKGFWLDVGSILRSKNRLKIDKFRKNGGSKAFFETLLL